MLGDEVTHNILFAAIIAIAVFNGVGLWRIGVMRTELKVLAKLLIIPLEEDDDKT